MSDPLGLIGQSGATPPTHPVNPLNGLSANRPGGATPGRDANGASFKDVLMENINQVNALQQDAEKAIEDLQTGRRDDMANVLIAKQKADTAFKMLQQVRNKLVDAYEEVKQMRV